MLYIVSAVNQQALRSSALRHAEFLQDTPHHLPDIAYSAFMRRSRYAQMLAVVGASKGEIEGGGSPS